MSTIQFRAWESGKMYYQVRCGGVFDGIPTAPTVWDEEKGWVNLTGQPHTKVMQFTGLTDKNGTPIYEGDIVQYKHYYATKRWWRNANEIPVIENEVQNQRNNFEVEKNKITFKDGGFYLGYSISGRDIEYKEKFIRGSNNTSDYEERYWYFEVIGNVFEDPELMEGIA